jgi:DNA repair exonuclease SbcCD ATPase subunit
VTEVRAVITQQEGTVSCNFAEVEAYIKERLKEYDGAIFTEESKGYAKKELAKLRAEKKELNDNLRDAKKKYMAPWDTFEPKVKELINLFDEPITLIDGQVKAFEEDRIAQKKALIEAIYTELVGDLADIIPLERIYNPKWENATTKEKAIREEVLAQATAARIALDTIRGMRSDAESKALDVYKQTLSLPEAISCINAYEAQKAEILRKEQERQREEELERIRREEREKLEEREAQRRAAEEALEEQRRQLEAEKQTAVEHARETGAQEVIESLTPDTEEDTQLYEYRVALSKKGKEAFEMYLDSVGIDWEMI